MDDLSRGTWIVNSMKHLVKVRTNTPELSYFEATEISGKSGLLLGRLVGDEQEIVPAAKLRVFARESGITGAEILTCLAHLKKTGKIDYAADTTNIPDVEVYCFSAQDVLETTSTLYDQLEASDQEQASLISLDKTFHVPCYKSDLVEAITSSGFSEETAVMTMKLQDALELVRTSKGGGEPIYYNEYAFAGDPETIAKALQGLNTSERQAVQDIQDLIEQNPGYPLETLAKKFPSTILKMMEGVGLVDALQVYSAIGDATFLTLPQLKGISIGASPLSMDVFHKAKLLLGCLRFGEIKSQPWRGKIESHDKMMNIVRKLTRGEWVGPCTAIGQDYQLLEKDGVIATSPAGGSMYLMKLRQKEVGILVKQMLEFKRAFPEADSELQKLLERQPVKYTMPEERRSQILANQTKPVKEIHEKLLQSLRTGTK